MHPLICGAKRFFFLLLLAWSAAAPAQGGAGVPNPEILSLQPDGVPYSFSTGSWLSAMSYNGRHVLYIVPAFFPLGSATPPGCCIGRQYVLRDRQDGSQRVVSVNAAGFAQDETSSGQFPFLTLAVSDDGRRVIFTSLARNLTPGTLPDQPYCYLWDRGVGHARALDLDPRPGLQPGLCGGISADGRTVAGFCRRVFPNVETWAICTLEVDTGVVTEEAEHYQASLGREFGAQLALSADASTLVFVGQLWDAPPGSGVTLRYDRASGTATEVLSGQPNGLAVSGDGRFVAIDGLSSRIYDHADGSLRVVSRIPPAPFSSRPALGTDLSRDGRFVMFRTRSSEFAARFGIPFNDRMRIYRVDVITGEIVLVSRVGLDGPPAVSDGDGCDIPFTLPCPAQLFTPRISGNGRYVSFQHPYDVLGPSYPPPTTTPAAPQLFLKDLGPVRPLGSAATPVPTLGPWATMVMIALVVLLAFVVRASFIAPRRGV